MQISKFIDILVETMQCCDFNSHLERGIHFNSKKLRTLASIILFSLDKD